MDKITDNHLSTRDMISEDEEAISWVIESLMDNLIYTTKSWDKHRLSTMRVWDPFCRSGFLAESLQPYFREVIATDVHDTDYGEVFDINNCAERPFGVDFIVSLPHDDLSSNMVRKCMSFANEGVSLLIPVNNKVDPYPESITFSPGTIKTGLFPDQFMKVDHGKEYYAWYLWPGKHLSVHRDKDFKREDRILDHKPKNTFSFGG